MNYVSVSWMVETHPGFDPEFDALPLEVRRELLARALLLEQFGPGLGRPNVDTLSGSSFSNMKELRFQKDGVWRFAFAFDPQKSAIILCGGDKQGKNQKRFYKWLIDTADERFSEHVKSLVQAGKR